MNAKQELLSQLDRISARMICATISYDTMWGYDNEDYRKEYNLKTIYSAEDYDFFINSLDFNYDSGYGSQELFGNVWFADGTWLERWEYDGSEGWGHKKCPEIPQKLAFTI